MFKTKKDHHMYVHAYIRTINLVTSKYDILLL